jgi:hypothetical protein
MRLLRAIGVGLVAFIMIVSLAMGLAFIKCLALGIAFKFLSALVAISRGSIGIGVAITLFIFIYKPLAKKAAH